MFCRTTDTLDFQLECVKMFLRKFCYQGPNYKQNFRANAEVLLKGNNRKTPSFQGQRIWGSWTWHDNGTRHKEI